MNALNFAILGYVAYMLWSDRTSDAVEGIVRIVIIVGLCSAFGYKLGGWI